MPRILSTGLMQTSDRTVIVTQSRLSGITSNALDIRHAPIITTETLPFDEKIFAVDYDWLILTSPNAVKHFMRFISRVNYRKLASIGVKTTESLRKHGIAVDFEPTGYSQETFMKEFEADGNKRILYPVSLNARPLLYDHLTRNGMSVTRIRLYKPVPNEVSLDEIGALLDSKPFAITFSSPSGVKAYADRFGPKIPEDTIVAAIGHVTADALKKYGIKSVRPGKETLQDMIDMLEYGMDRGVENEF